MPFGLLILSHEIKQNNQATLAAGNSVDISFNSVDPAPPLNEHLSVSKLKARLLDAKASLFDRYRAMFSLRNRASTDAVLVMLTTTALYSSVYLH